MKWPFVGICCRGPAGEVADKKPLQNKAFFRYGRSGVPVRGTRVAFFFTTAGAAAGRPNSTRAHPAGWRRPGCHIIGTGRRDGKISPIWTCSEIEVLSDVIATLRGPAPVKCHDGGSDMQRQQAIRTKRGLGYRQIRLPRPHWVYCSPHALNLIFGFAGGGPPPSHSEIEDTVSGNGAKSGVRPMGWCERNMTCEVLLPEP